MQANTQPPTPSQTAAMLTLMFAGCKLEAIADYCQTQGFLSPAIGEFCLADFRNSHSEAYQAAAQTGVTMRLQRIARLNERAMKLGAVLWEPDEHGHYPNGATWRKTLRSIREEVEWIKRNFPDVQPSSAPLGEFAQYIDE